MARRKGQPLDGWLILDKPLGQTSTAMVGRARWLLDARKCGHAGTLDPLATGVLPLAFGEATKTLPFLVDRDKEYRFTIAFGAETDSGDAEGRVIHTSEVRPGVEAVEGVLPQFRGSILQRPPIFSALKVGGQRAYDLARAGEEVELAPRPVVIHALAVETADADSVSLRVVCSKGTYVRSLARDIAAALGSCGHVSQLRRTRVGPFHESAAISLDTVSEIGDGPVREQGRPVPALLDRILPLATALDDIPAVAVAGEAAQRLRSGQAVRHPSPGGSPGLSGVDGTVSASLWLVVTAEDRPVALAEHRGELLVPVRVFNLAS